MENRLHPAARGENWMKVRKKKARFDIKEKPTRCGGKEKGRIMERGETHSE